MCEDCDAIPKSSLGLELILFSPFRSIHGVRPNLSHLENKIRWRLGMLQIRWF